MKECTACGGATKRSIFGNECIVCGMTDMPPAPAPCVHGVIAAGRNKCSASEVSVGKRAAVVELLSSKDCPMGSSCPGFEKRVGYESFETRIARISTGDGYGFDDDEALSVSKRLVATRLGKSPGEIAGAEWMSVAHVYDGIKKEGI